MPASPALARAGSQYRWRKLLTDDPDGLHVQVDVAAAKRCQFTPPQAREHCQQHQRPVPGVDGVGQCEHLGNGEHGPLWGPLLACAFDPAGIPRDQAVVSGGVHDGLD